MNGNDSVMKRKPQMEELEDGEREKRRKRVEEVSPAPIEFPMNRSMENAVPENPLAPLLDRSGGLAKEKCIRPFLELMRNERRLKHRIALLTVLQLTNAEFVPELLKQQLLVTLHDWMQDAISVGTPPCMSFMKSILTTLLSMELIKDCPGQDQWSGVVEKLKGTEIEELSQQLKGHWNKEGEVSGQGSRRIDGLNTPIPKASFRKAKLQLPSSDQVKISIRAKLPPTLSHTSKRVRWAPESKLVEIRTFNDDDPPDQILVTPTAAATRPQSFAEEATIHARRKWTAPVRWNLVEEWNVKNGEESEEKQVQLGRDRRVVAFDVQSGRTHCTSGNPEEPFLNDSFPDPHHQIPFQHL